MPTSSFDKEFILETEEEVKRFIEAVEKSKKHIENQNIKVEYKDVKKEQIKELFK